MSDGEEAQDVAVPGPSQAEGVSATPLSGSSDQIFRLQSQLNELSKKHDDVMSSIASLGDVQPRSIVYIPREKPIVPFNGDPCKDTHSVDEFIEEVERAISLRGLRETDQVDFILSHLRGSALDEVKLRTRGQAKRPSDLFAYLREAFREKRTTQQLLHVFYARRQLEGEDLREYSHALSQLFNSVLLTSPDVVNDPQLMIRDQFIEGLRDSALRRELRRLIRERPSSTLVDVREEAIMWCLDERPRGTNVARNRKIVGDGCDENVASGESSGDSRSDLASTLQEVIKIMAQQGKAIGELTNAVRELTIQQATSSMTNQPKKPKVTPKYTGDGQPVCLRCEGIGHMARQCPARRIATDATASSATQGNEDPRLL